MLPLSASLLAHQQGAARVPAITVTARAQRDGAHLLRWERIYRGPEADAPVAAAVMGNGAFVAARNDAGALYVSYPWGPTGANPGFWVAVDTGLTAGTGVALAGRAGEALLAYAKGSTVYVRTSSNNGVTWGTASAVVTEAVAVGFVAIAFNGSDACLFYNVGATVKRLRRTAGAWAASGTAWTGSIAGCTGLAACYDGTDFVLLLTGTEAGTGDPRCWVTQMGDAGLPANAWGGLVTLAEADAAGTTTFAGPSVVSVGGELHGAFVQRESGAVAADRAFEVHPPAGAVPLAPWSEPQPHEAETAEGLALAWGPGSAGSVFAATASGAWRCEVGAEDDLGDRLLALRVRFGPTSTHCRAELDNTDGALAVLPSDGYPGTMAGGTLEVVPGYRSGAGGASESGVAWRFTVDSISYRQAGARRTVVVEASGAWETLGRWRARQPWQTAAGALNRSQVALRVAARAGLDVLSEGTPSAPSAEWTAYSPSFAVVQGESGATALARLLAPVNDGVRSESGPLVVTGLASPRFEDVMAAMAPRAWWRLHEPPNTTLVQERSGQYNGAAFNSAYLGFGKAGPLAAQPTAAARFDGVDDAVQVPAHAALDLSTFTLAAFVKSAGAGSGVRRVISHRDGAGTYYAMGLDGGVPWFGSSGDGWSDTRGGAIDDGEWHLLAVTRVHGGTVTWYVDGAAVGTRAASGILAPAPTAPVVIGAADTAGTAALAADLSEVAVFARVLSADEVAALWRAASPAVYAYGGGGHPVVALSLDDAPAEANWVRLQGPDRYADTFDARSVAQHGPRFASHRNLDATTDARALDYSEGALRRAAWALPVGGLRAPFNAGQQLFDVVSVTHRHLAPGGALYRVLGVGLDYARVEARYESVLTLGAL